MEIFTKNKSGNTKIWLHSHASTDLLYFDQNKKLILWLKFSSNVKIPKDAEIMSKEDLKPYLTALHNESCKLLKFLK